MVRDKKEKVPGIQLAARHDEQRERAQPISEWGCRAGVPVNAARSVLLQNRLCSAQRESGSTTGENGEPWGAQPGSENDIAVVRDCARSLAPASRERRALVGRERARGQDPAAGHEYARSRVPIESGRAVRSGVELHYSPRPARPTSVSTCTFAKRREGRCTRGRRRSVSACSPCSLAGDDVKKEKHITKWQFVLRQQWFWISLSNNGIWMIEKLEKHDLHMYALNYLGKLYLKYYVLLNK